MTIDFCRKSPGLQRQVSNLSNLVTKMKNIIKQAMLPVALVFGSCCFSVAMAGSYDCRTKRSAIEYQIQQAEKYGNTHRSEGLRRALDQVNARCTSGDTMQVTQEKVSKLEKKLADKQKDVRKADADLQEARAKGDATKAAKYQKSFCKSRQIWTQ